MTTWDILILLIAAVGLLAAVAYWMAADELPEPPVQTQPHPVVYRHTSLSWPPAARWEKALAAGMRAIAGLAAAYPGTVTP